jgi:hypothetical protein
MQRFHPSRLFLKAKIRDVVARVVGQLHGVTHHPSEVFYNFRPLGASRLRQRFLNGLKFVVRADRMFLCNLGNELLVSDHVVKAQAQRPLTVSMVAVL